MSMDWLPIDLLWRGALVVVPLAVLVTAIGSLFPCRPSTRHAMWLVVLVVLVASPFLPRLKFGQLPVGPPVEMVHAPRTELAPRREQEVFAPTASSGPPVAAVEQEPWGIAGRRLSGGEAIVKRETLTEPSGLNSAPVGRRTQMFSGVAKPPLPHVTVIPRGRGGLATPEQSLVAEPVLAEWVRRANAVWLAVLRLPPIPLPVWMGGIAVLGLVGLGRIGRSVRLVRSGRTAPRAVVRMVRDAATDLGLRQPPAVVMVDRRVTPMLWCGRQATLVLPSRLWAQLDDVGRRAVIFHELAHLRRRDHWVCWADMIVGWVYWWHPVVWWIRRRIREEADLCCDNWVTTLLPDGRRAYAQALLDARRFGSLTPAAVPAVGLGASTNRTKRFARRLTMVMTAQTSPRISRKGALLACTLALGGVLVTPLWACPDADDAKPARVKAPRAPKAPKAPKAPRAPEAPPFPAWHGDSETTFEQFMKNRDGMSHEQQMQQLERELERLHRRLQGIHQNRAPRQRTRERSRERGRASIAIPGVLAYALSARNSAVIAGGDGCGGCIASAAVGSGPIVVRTYELSKGKLSGLVELMVRSDVPIRVRPLDDGIEVHATEGQQCLFEAFVMMIGKGESKQSYKLSGGKLEALTALMVRPDVPIFVEPKDDGIKVHGSELEQAIFGAFVTMINPDGGVTRANDSHAYATALAKMASQYESQAAAQVQQMQGLRAAMLALANQGDSIERQADRMRDKADRLRNEADKIRDKAEQLRDEADELEGRKRRSALDRAKAIMQKAKAIEREAEALDDQAAVIEQQAERILEQAEAIEEQIEEVQELADRRDDD